MIDIKFIKLFVIISELISNFFFIYINHIWVTFEYKNELSSFGFIYYIPFLPNIFIYIKKKWINLLASTKTIFFIFYI